MPIPAKRGEATVVERDEHPARDQPRGARQAADPVPRRRHGDGRQLVGRQRRRLRAAARERRRAVKRFGLTPRARVVGTAVAGVEPRIMGIGPVRGHAQGARARSASSSTEIDRHRAQRGVCRAGARRAARARHRRRRGARQPPGRRHRARPSAGRERRAPGDHGAAISSSAAAAATRLCTMCIGVGQGIAMVLERIPGRA